MKMKGLLIIALLSILLGCKHKNHLDEISSKSEDGFQNIALTIVDKHMEGDSWIAIAKGQYKGTIVGLKIKIKNGLRPDIVNGVLDRHDLNKDAVEISSIGKESDNFIKALSELYGFKTNKGFTSKPLVFTCMSLNTELAFLDKGLFKFKLYYDQYNENGSYAEIYLNPNLPNDEIGLQEKDPVYRKNLIKIMTK